MRSGKIWYGRWWQTHRSCKNTVLKYLTKYKRQYVKHVFYMRHFVPNLYPKLSMTNNIHYIHHCFSWSSNSLIEHIYRHRSKINSSIICYPPRSVSLEKDFLFIIPIKLLITQKQQKLVTFLVMSLFLAEYTLN